VEAALNYQDGSLDMVFIDAAHDYDNVRADIAAWYPKVRLGGMLAGHDYEENWPGVIQAVNEFAIVNNYNVIISGNSWVIYV
ncbi:class I SAM-dependent methyltransferase, partial [bacterium]|nr:class I SAM-dependent methyltransferase [bacterium]